MTKTYDEFDFPWKAMLEWYFEAFMLFFFPAAHADIDWNRGVEFLDKELRPVVRDAELGRRYVDKLAKVWRKSGEEEWVLAHLEVQGQHESAFDRRMYSYNYRLFDRYDRPVASFAVINEEGVKWKPGKFSYDLWGCKINFEFPVVKLMDYKARWPELEESDNPFATVVMAHIKAIETQNDPEQRGFWKFYLTRRLYERGYARQDVLNLFHFIDWLMRLPEDLEALFEQQVEQLEGEKQMGYVTSIERRARKEGRDEGFKEGRQEQSVRLLLRLLSHRFGEVPAVVDERLQRLSLEQLEALIDNAMTVPALDDFVTHLPEATPNTTVNDA